MNQKNNQIANRPAKHDRRKKIAFIEANADPATLELVDKKLDEMFFVAVARSSLRRAASDLNTKIKIPVSLSPETVSKLRNPRMRRSIYEAIEREFGSDPATHQAAW